MNDSFKTNVVFPATAYQIDFDDNPKTSGSSNHRGVMQELEGNATLWESHGVDYSDLRESDEH